MRKERIRRKNRTGRRRRRKKNNEKEDADKKVERTCEKKNGRNIKKLTEKGNSFREEPK